MKNLKNIQNIKFYLNFYQNILSNNSKVIHLLIYKYKKLTHLIINNFLHIYIFLKILKYYHHLNKLKNYSDSLNNQFHYNNNFLWFQCIMNLNISYKINYHPHITQYYYHNLNNKNNNFKNQLNNYFKNIILENNKSLFKNSNILNIHQNMKYKFYYLHSYNIIKDILNNIKEYYFQ